ncbi:MAG TPA: aldo/keto reductase [Actinomycetota bacterium]|jgi:aryl-alcohol dehydrogenase-like predicted oxidoreductase
MEYTHVGHLGLVVSRLCLGTMNFGPHTDEGESHTLMDSALAHGINFFDTANVYGRHLGVGATEDIIGRWFAKGSGRRDKVVLATKVYGTMGDWPNEARLSKLAIRKACEASLRRLRTDHIDLYQMHHIDRDAWWDEIWEAFEQLKREGKILYVGSSNFAGWHIARANEIANWRHSLGLASEQSLYNLTARTIELEVIPAIQEYGMGLIPWSPLAGGLLAGALEKVEKGWRRSQEYMAGEIEDHRDKLVKWEALCDELGERPADVALAWLLHQPVVTAPIIGPRTEEQLLSNLHALEIDLSDEVLAKLDEIFPGPGGTAPEAYAW